MSNKLYILFSGLFILISMTGIYVVIDGLQEKPLLHVKTSSVAAKPIKAVDKKNNDNVYENQSLTILNMWYDLAPDDEVEGVRLNNDVKISRKVGIHTDLFSAIKAGYKVQLPSLVGGNYLLELGKVEKITDDEIQIYGEIVENNETYFSTISIMGNTLLAILSTPNGDYDLNMIDGKGIVYKSEDSSSIQDNQAKSVVDIDSALLGQQD